MLITYSKGNEKSHSKIPTAHLTTKNALKQNFGDLIIKLRYFINIVKCFVMRLNSIA